MARRYRKKRSGRKKSIRLGATMGMLAGAYMMWRTYKDHPGAAFPPWLVQGLSGYDYTSGNWDIKKANILLPMAVGAGVSLVASKIGLNRYTPRGINI